MQSENSKKHRFQKGNTFGSGTQRTKGISTYIKDRTNNLKDIIDGILKDIKDGRISATTRLKNRELLLAYGVGKPTQFMDMTHRTDTPLAELLERVDEQSGANTDTTSDTLA